MKYTIDIELLKRNNLTLQEFGILLYFAGGGDTLLITSICKNLWEKGYLIKELGKYVFNSFKFEELENILSEGSNTRTTNKRAEILAPKIRALFPEGYKESIIGGSSRKYSWRDSDRVIAQRLKTFFKRYGEKWKDEEIIKATERYVNDNSRDKTFMKILKYFIFKDKGKQDGEGKGYIEESSDLLSYLENPSTEGNSQDIGELV